MCYIGVAEEKIEKEDKISLSVFIFIYTIHFRANLKVYTKLKTLVPIGNKKSVTEISIGEKENEQIKGLICTVWLLFATQYNSSPSSFFIKFQNSKSSSC